MDDYRNQMCTRGIPLGEKYIQLSSTFVEDVITMWSRKFDKSSDLVINELGSSNLSSNHYFNNSNTDISQ